MAPASTIEDLSDRYANFMINPATAGPGVCSSCRTFCNDSFSMCYPCGHELPRNLDVMVPITYSVDLGQMHTALRGYKDGWAGNQSDRLKNTFTSELAAVLWRFLRLHEDCVATAAGVAGFDVVTNVPSSTDERDAAQWRLRWMLETGCRQTADRFERLLKPTPIAAQGKAYDPGRYAPTMPLTGKNVLLVDDTWTQGRSAQSAAYALKQAGADSVALVVLGRHIDPGWEPEYGTGVTCADLLKDAPGWSWDVCGAEA